MLTSHIVLHFQMLVSLWLWGCMTSKKMQMLTVAVDVDAKSVKQKGRALVSPIQRRQELVDNGGKSLIGNLV
mgnify:CR=1